MEINIVKEVEKFITTLENSIIARVFRVIDLLEQFGPKLKMPHSKPIGQGLFELRIRGNKEIRIIYAYQNNTAILLNIFIKKSNQIPKKEINIAYQRLKDLT